MKHAVTISICFVIACAGAALASSTDALTSWAEHAAPQAVNAVATETPTKVDDHFGTVPYAQWKDSRRNNGLAAHGIDLPTAEAGSTWVYDPVHRIAAECTDGQQVGDYIMYASPPPSTIPARDLSHVVSAHGLTLGMSPAQAAHDLGIASTAVLRLDARDSAISTDDIVQHNGMSVGHYATVVFHDGHAVYISLGDAGP
jgi:hypothetical protein